MSRGKYSPYCKSIEDGAFDYYGYDKNGRDRAGKTEDDYLLMDDITFDNHYSMANTASIYIEPNDQLTRLQDAIEQIDIKAESGLSMRGHPLEREFLKDIRQIIAELTK